MCYSQRLASLSDHRYLRSTDWKQYGYHFRIELEGCPQRVSNRAGVQIMENRLRSAISKTFKVSCSKENKNLGMDGRGASVFVYTLQCSSTIQLLPYSCSLYHYQLVYKNGVKDFQNLALKRLKPYRMCQASLLITHYFLITFLISQFIKLSKLKYLDAQ